MLRLLLLLIAVAMGVAAAPRPNIVFILADDLGYGDLGCYGQSVIQTPHLDRLAAGGMRFTDFYSGSTVCAPSRSCLMTGQHTGHTYLRGNGNHRLRLDPQDRTIGSLLQGAGYDTAMIGKACTVGNLTDMVDHPNRKGFDHFFGVLSHVEAHHYFPPIMYRNGKTIRLPNNQEHEGDTYIHDEMLTDAKNWIASERDKPFFMIYSALIPHASLYAEEKWVAKYRGKVGPERVIKQGHYRGTKEPNAVFAGMVSRLDWEVGQLVAALDKAGLAENTLILFASDNGAQSAGGHQESDFNSSGPLRGEKRDMYEGGIRSPLIASWPGTVEAGTVSDHVGAFWDVLPTACDLAGTPHPAGLDGISFFPTLLGKGTQREHEYLYWEFFEKGGRRALRIGDYKVVQNDLLKKKQGPIEIYNLKTDLAETNNIAAETPAIVARAKRLFQEARTRSPVPAFNFDRKTKK